MISYFDSRSLCALLRFDLLPSCPFHAVDPKLIGFALCLLPLDLIEIFIFVKLHVSGFKSFSCDIAVPFWKLKNCLFHVMPVVSALVYSISWAIQYRRFHFLMVDHDYLHRLYRRIVSQDCISAFFGFVVLDVYV